MPGTAGSKYGILYDGIPCKGVKAIKKKRLPSPKRIIKAKLKKKKNGTT